MFNNSASSFHNSISLLLVLPLARVKLLQINGKYQDILISGSRPSMNSIGVRSDNQVLYWFPTSRQGLWHCPPTSWPLFGLFSAWDLLGCVQSVSLMEPWWFVLIDESQLDSHRHSASDRRHKSHSLLLSVDALVSQFMDRFQIYMLPILDLYSFMNCCCFFTVGSIAALSHELSNILHTSRVSDT